MSNWMMTVMGQSTVDYYKQIRDLFNKVKPGDEILIESPHRDMHEKGMAGDFYLLPDRHEAPKTFSLKQIIEDSLNAICTQAHPDLAELDYSGEPLEEGLGYWKLLDLKIEDGYIHATIKKL